MYSQAAHIHFINDAFSKKVMKLSVTVQLKMEEKLEAVLAVDRGSSRAALHSEGALRCTAVVYLFLLGIVFN